MKRSIPRFAGTAWRLIAGSRTKKPQSNWTFSATPSQPASLAASLLLLVFAFSHAAMGQNDHQALTEKFSWNEYGISLNYPANWSEVPQQFSNSHRLVNVPEHLQGLERIDARIKIFVETRTGWDDGLRELQSLARGMGATPSELMRIDGHLALQTRRMVDRPQPSRGPRFEDEQAFRLDTSILTDHFLIHIDATLPSDASASAVNEVLAIIASLEIDEPPSTRRVDNALLDLRASQSELLRSRSDKDVNGVQADSDPGMPRAGLPQLEPRAVQSPPSRLNQRIYNDRFGEVEIAVSPDGQQVIVGRQSEWVTSNDGGVTFPFSGVIGAFDGGDPSVAWAQSGAFYYAGIDRFCTNAGNGYLGPLTASTFGDDCTGMAVSNDNGQTFVRNNLNPAVICPRDDPNNPGAVANQCFPDQEHIAADRVNAGAGDQIYSTWRNFDATDQDAGLVCSQDSGQNWTMPLDLGPNSFFPRITVGQDGFVYVVAYGGGNYRIWKFSSCANGLNLQAGFPTTVGPRTPVDCPFAGHDRCDQNPSSQTVAVDDTNPNHLYFAYAQSDGTVNRDATIFVRDSFDGGLTWRAPVRVNANVAGPRIMPWVCSTGGDAFVTWFDRRAAPPCPNGNCPGIQNDLTHFYAGRAGLDLDGNLVLKNEFRISEVQDAWCGAPGTPWPTATRQAFNPAPGASEACSLQPQLGGRCCLDANNDQSCDAQPPNWSGTACDISDNDCTAPEVCLGGNGVPRYGDYNGNACAAGRLFAAWPSANSPAGEPVPTVPAVGILFDAFLVGEVPLIQVPNAIAFESCPGISQSETFNVCNTGNENLLVSSIESSDPAFDIQTPSGGFPVQISPDFCFPFELGFESPDSGSQSAILTVNSNDPATPAEDIEVTAEVGQSEISTTFNGDFGDVCLGDSLTRELLITNPGNCPLTVSGISSTNSEFGIAQVMDFPQQVSAGGEITVPIEFSPAGNFGPESGQISIDHDGGNTPSPKNLTVSGNSPSGSLNTALANQGAFGNVCKGDQADLSLTLFNQGQCNLTIESIGINPPGSSFELPADTTFPLILSPDADFNLPIRYAPEACNDELEQATVVIETDDPANATAEIGISGTSACPNLVIDPAGLQDLFAFPATVVDRDGSLGCHSDASVTLRNNGGCPLTIDDISAQGFADALDFGVTAPSQFPILLPPGEETLAVNVRFTPQDDANPVAPNQSTGELTIVSDDPDAAGTAALCGESTAQSGVRILVTDITTGFPIMLDPVEKVEIQSKGINRPGPIKLTFNDAPLQSADICGNTRRYHVNQETLPSTDSTGGGGRQSSYDAGAKQGNLQTTENFTLAQCEFREFQLQLQSGNSDPDDPGACLLLPRGEVCTNDGECCSGKCRGPAGNMICR